MDQEARAGIVGASVLPPLQRDRRIYDNRDPAHCFSSHVFVAANRLPRILSLHSTRLMHRASIVETD